MIISVNHDLFASVIYISVDNTLSIIYTDDITVSVFYTISQKGKYYE